MSSGNIPLRGPVLLSGDDIRDKIEPDRLGGYLLGYYDCAEAAMRVKRFGRSDDDLQYRLLRYTKDPDHTWDARGCSHLLFQYVATKVEGFRLECEFFHFYETPPRNNDPDTHPVRPKGYPEKGGLRCHICGWPDASTEADG
jgi:hypothetical protein